MQHKLNLLWSALRRVADNWEVALAMLLRGTLGLPIAIVFGFGGWAVAWRTHFQGELLSMDSFVISQALVVGMSAAAGAAVCWWNPETPARTRWLITAATFAVGAAAAFLYPHLLGVETYNTLLGGVKRIPAISLQDALPKMILPAAIASNAFAGAIAAYRMTKHREL